MKFEILEKKDNKYEIEAEEFGREEYLKWKSQFTKK